MPRTKVRTSSGSFWMVSSRTLRVEIGVGTELLRRVEERLVPDVVAHTLGDERLGRLADLGLLAADHRDGGGIAGLDQRDVPLRIEPPFAQEIARDRVRLPPNGPTAMVFPLK